MIKMQESTFDEIISFENLYKAHRRARLGKRHKKEVIEFEMNLSENLWQLHYDLKYGRYQIGGYHKFMIYDPKEREIQAISYRDRVVQHTLCDNFLIPLMERKLIYDNGACRKEKGTHFVIGRLRKFMTEHYKKYVTSGYFVKMDVKKYFDSIDHNKLKNLLNKEIAEEKIKKLVFSVIDSYCFSENKGLPMGNQSSQCFALYYLDEVDRFIKEKLKIKYYIRYMDDMIAITPDKTSANLCLEAVSEKLIEKNLQMNVKSQVVAIKNGINFLGWHFRFGENGKILQTIRKQSLLRMKTKLKETILLFKKHKISKKRLIQSQNSLKGHLEKGNTYKILNNLIKDFIINKSVHKNYISLYKKAQTP